MKFIVFLSIFVSNLFCADFITKDEYAKMLYQNPRGISCAKCHGKDAKGSVIARYKDIKTKKVDGEIFKEEVSKTLEAPDITNLNFERFKNAVVDSKGVMPTYFLTIDEIKSLYYYVNKNTNQTKGKK
ncbi:cytochrome C oxidase subunit III [Campylobacter sp. RM12327]|uniref:hypothetical protein n=1 Tax=Campylobacter sputorum TaxID=206 RepID=UPI000B775609|nr:MULTISPECIES: hypothetical protein [Campylobacter]ASM39759.1 putative cytochrome c [Campylobacter sputorum]MBF6668851.1 cytochrome C oxidase subunit III [Campylobacter sp. RM12327]MBF6673765.1 cytochrome C oxidase subunit III [Campylobacter sp. RM13538]MBF6676220.1 cytochrome C oxidase subunit III [Campylobacter sp. RM12321]MBF6678155.1 cytochrome C oxidase subunit III [Campylobacter sp. RM11259]